MARRDRWCRWHTPKSSRQVEPAIGVEQPMPAAPVNQEGATVTQAALTPQTTNGLTILLGEGAQGEAGAVTGPAVAEGEPLSEAETQALVDARSQSA